MAFYVGDLSRKSCRCALGRIPRIERIDDFTARVTNTDGTVDVNFFRSSTAKANNATIVIDLPSLQPLPAVYP